MYLKLKYFILVIRYGFDIGIKNKVYNDWGGVLHFYIIYCLVVYIYIYK